MENSTDFNRMQIKKMGRREKGFTRKNQSFTARKPSPGSLVLHDLNQWESCQLWANCLLPVFSKCAYPEF